MKRIRIIVAGSRCITDEQFIFEHIEKEIQSYDADDVEFVTGMAAGPDLLGKKYAEENDYPWVEFPADWDNLKVAGALIRTNRGGHKYNAKAGYDRNQKMADYATHLFAFWDGKSGGTKDMVSRALANRLKVKVFKYKGESCQLSQTPTETKPQPSCSTSSKKSSRKAETETSTKVTSAD